MENLFTTFVREFLLATFQGVPLIFVVFVLVYGAKLISPALEGNATRIVSLVIGVVVSVTAKLAETGFVGNTYSDVLAIVFSGIAFGGLASLAYDQVIRVVDNALNVVLGELMEFVQIVAVNQSLAEKPDENVNPGMSLGEDEKPCP